MLRGCGYERRIVVEGSDTNPDAQRSPRRTFPINLREKIERLLVASGSWSTSGAHEIVSLFSVPVGTGQSDLDWPGPIDEPEPLFTQ